MNYCLVFNGLKNDNDVRLIMIITFNYQLKYSKYSIVESIYRYILKFN